MCGVDAHQIQMGVVGCFAQRNQGGGPAQPACGTFAEQSTPALPSAHGLGRLSRTLAVYLKD